MRKNTNTEQVELPFPIQFKPFIKDQTYCFNIKFRAIGLIKTEEIKPGMFIGDGKFCWIQHIFSIEKEDDRDSYLLSFSSGDIKNRSNPESVWTQFELVNVSTEDYLKTMLRRG